MTSESSSRNGYNISPLSLINPRFEDGNNYYNTNEEVEFINRIFPGCKNISIDYGLLEKAENVFVYPSEFGWSDLGTWGSLYDHLKL